MDIAELIAAVDQLSPNDLASLKEHIQKREAELRSKAVTWGAALEAAAADFRADSSPEELDAIFEAINHKSPSSDKGL